MLKRLGWLGLLALCAWVQGDTTLRLGDGAELMIPNGFFYRLEFLDHEPENTVLRGDCRNLSSSSFLFISQAPSRREGNDPFVAMAQALDLSYREPTPVKREIPGLKSPFRVARITSPGAYEGFLAVLVSEVWSRGAVSFFLVGPEAEFQQALPGFVAMVNQYDSAQARSAKKIYGQKRNNPSSWMVIAAIGVLVANLFIILFGFKEIARRGNEEEPI